MKYFVIISAILITGCASTQEGIDYLGQQPWYAKKVLTPAPTSAILKVQQSKKDNMSLSKNARCSQIMQDIQKGKFVKNNKFRGYGETEVDRPSWDFRPIKIQKKKG